MTDMEALTQYYAHCKECMNSVIAASGDVLCHSCKCRNAIRAIEEKLSKNLGSEDKCKLTKNILDIQTGSHIMENEYGCTWCDGVGAAPDGTVCGECSNIDKKDCPVRKENKNGSN